MENLDKHIDKQGKHNVTLAEKMWSPFWYLSSEPGLEYFKTQ